MVSRAKVISLTSWRTHCSPDFFFHHHRLELQHLPLYRPSLATITPQKARELKPRHASPHHVTALLSSTRGGVSKPFSSNDY